GAALATARALSGHHRAALEQRLGRPGGHHAWQSPAGNRQLTLVGPGGYHHGADPDDGVAALALAGHRVHGEPRAGAGPLAGGRRIDMEARVPGQVRDPPGGLVTGEVVPQRAEGPPAVME